MSESFINPITWFDILSIVIPCIISLFIGFKIGQSYGRVQIKRELIPLCDIPEEKIKQLFALEEKLE